MSNEKPVRITVGDVKEVAEATMIETPATPSVAVSSSRPSTASMSPAGGNGLIGLAALVAAAMIIGAGIFAMGNTPPGPDVPKNGVAPQAVPSASMSAGPGASASVANNAPEASVASNNAPASNTAAEATSTAPSAAANN